MVKENYLCIRSEFNIKYDKYNSHKKCKAMHVITSIEKSYHFHHLGSNFRFCYIKYHTHTNYKTMYVITSHSRSTCVT